MSGLPVDFDEDALKDLRRQLTWLARKSDAGTARIHIARIETACNRIGQAPSQGRRMGDVVPGLRVVGFGRRDNICFFVHEGRIRITRILFGGQDVAKAFRRD